MTETESTSINVTHPMPTSAEPVAVVDRVVLRDRLIRVLRATPWLRTVEVAQRVEQDEAFVLAELKQLRSEGIAKRARARSNRWALIRVALPPRRTYKVVKLSVSGQAFLEVVRAHPWLPAGEYARIRGGKHRFDVYGLLNTLTRRGLVRMSIKDGVKHWGPAEGPVPPGHMLLAHNARSPRRQGIRERAQALLALKPWLTVSSIAAELHAMEKATDTCLRAMHGLGQVKREWVEGGYFTVYAYALPDAPPMGEEDKARVLATVKERSPEHYGRTLDKVLGVLDKHPWSTAEDVSLSTGIGLQAVYGALYRLCKQGALQRVADGVYRYARAGRPVDIEILGYLHRGSGNGTGRSKALDYAVEELAKQAGLTTEELRGRIKERTGRNYPGLHGLLSHAATKGYVTTTKGHRKGGRRRVQVNEWFLAAKPRRNVATVRGELEAKAAELRSLGYEVTLNIQPAPEA